MPFKYAEQRVAHKLIPRCFTLPSCRINRLPPLKPQLHLSFKCLRQRDTFTFISIRVDDMRIIKLAMAPDLHHWRVDEAKEHLGADVLVPVTKLIGLNCWWLVLGLALLVLIPGWLSHWSIFKSAWMVDWLLNLFDLHKINWPKL